MSGRPSRKSAEICCFRPLSAFSPFSGGCEEHLGNPENGGKKAFFLRYPLICLNPHLLNSHLRHSTVEPPAKDSGRIFSDSLRVSAQESELQAKSRSYRPKVRNTAGQTPRIRTEPPRKGTRMGFRCFYREPPLKLS